MPVLEMANEVGLTRWSLWRRRAISTLAAIGALACFWMAAGTAAATAEAQSLQRDGVVSSGSVVDVLARPVGRGQPANGSVVVRHAIDGEVHEQSIWVGSEVGSFQVGQTVDVVTDPDDPSQVLIAGVYSNRHIPVGPVLCIGLILLGMAVVSGLHVRAINRVLRWERWVVLSAKVIQYEATVGTLRSHVLLVLDAVDRQITVQPIGFNRLDPGFEPQAWVAGMGSRRVVVATPGGGHLLLCMPVTTH